MAEEFWKTTPMNELLNVRLLLLVAIAMSSGCASFCSLRASPNAPKGLSDHPRMIYGGTRDNLTYIDRPWPNSLWVYGPVGCLVIDTPFSIIMDTAALPFTIPYNLKETEKEEPTKCKEHPQ